jgi:hypothetical protein
LFGVFLVLVDMGTHVSGVGTNSENSAWVLMTACILFYALCSSVLSLRSAKINIYWRNAIFGFLILAVGSALVSTAVSGVSIDEAGSFRWIYVVLAIGYLVFLAIVRLMKRIVDIAIKQDDRLRGE